MIMPAQNLTSKEIYVMETMPILNVDDRCCLQCTLIGSLFLSSC